jgi:hypothetical protein
VSFHISKFCIDKDKERGDYEEIVSKVEVNGARTVHRYDHNGKFYAVVEWWDEEVKAAPETDKAGLPKTGSHPTAWEG